MRSTRLVVSLVAAITLSASAYPLEAQGIGGLIKKKAAEAVKPKDAKKAADTKDAEKPKDDPNTSNWEKEGCGPITPDRLNDLLRGLETERTQQAEFRTASGHRARAVASGYSRRTVRRRSTQNVLSSFR